MSGARLRAARRLLGAGTIAVALAWPAVAAPAAAAPAVAGTPAARPDDAAALRRALAPHAWMSAQPDWPCRYGARVQQRRVLGERVLSSAGRVFQDCERGLVWLVERPLPGAQVYARGANYLALNRRGAPRVLDGLAERRIGALLQGLFAGDIEALHREFEHHPAEPAPTGTGQGERGTGVRLVPRDARLAARLDGIVIRGDATRTTIGVDTVDTGPAGTLEWRLEGFEALPADAGAAALRRCTDWLSDGEDGSLERAACDALARPGRWLEKARSGQR